MTAVFGASLGVSGIHGLSVDLADTSSTSTESFVAMPPASQNHWHAVTSAVRDMAGTSTTPVLALRDKQPTEAYGVEYVDGLALVSDLGAQIGALQESSLLSGEKTVALFDAGAGGVTVSIVDVGSGVVQASRRSTVFSGDGCDAALTRYLLDRYGHGRQLAPDAQEFFVEMVCAGKERLSRFTEVEFDGPFPGGPVTVYRTDLDDLVRNDVYDAVTLAESMIAAGPRVDALFAVGGAANMQIVRQSLFDAVSVPVFVPVEPQLLAARGAVGMARGFAAGRAPARSAAPPRHSDSSSRHTRRLKRSRYLAGVLAVLVAGGVAAAAVISSTKDEQVTVVDRKQPAPSTPSDPPVAILPAAAPPEPESATTTTTSDDTTQQSTSPPVPTTTATTTTTESTTTRAPRATTTTVPPTTVTTTTDAPRTSRETTRQSPTSTTSSTTTR
ncbi:Hsp70 family protein [Rhodococcoides kyotonense]|uniref:Hsp70 protein n=1 Tax=Rhodococcoides kyotonense TaxID=398843 RepID=A0A239J7Q7_9NOCA|nr:Hsp70 family protein [Rhodococcus kyotonensis]SNT01870.1 Hsp70 protein [Rhodococcus kyotonensis]